MCNKPTDDVLTQEFWNRIALYLCLADAHPENSSDKSVQINRDLNTLDMFITSFIQVHTKMRNLSGHMIEDAWCYGDAESHIASFGRQLKHHLDCIEGK